MLIADRLTLCKLAQSYICQKENLVNNKLKKLTKLKKCFRVVGKIKEDKNG